MGRSALVLKDYTAHQARALDPGLRKSPHSAVAKDREINVRVQPSGRFFAVFGVR
jgi:hypothetical protein